MSNSSQEKNKKNNVLEQSQNNQNEVGNAENNPETEGPSENLREEALETTNNESDQKEPAKILYFGLLYYINLDLLNLIET